MDSSPFLNGIDVPRWECQLSATKKEESVNNITSIAVDLAKHKFQVHGYAGPQQEKRFAKTLTRQAFDSLLRELPPCTVAMEACSSAHFWSRRCEELGHRPLQIPTQFVKPFLIGHKTDPNDTEAIHEASLRPSLRPVPVKSVEQQDAMLVHLTRERLKKNRLALTNEIRGVLRERGLVFSASLKTLREGVRKLLTQPLSSEFTSSLTAWLTEALSEWAALDQRFARLERALKHTFAHSEDCQRLAAVPGVGPLTATAFLARLPEVRHFPSTRHAAASLGITPRVDRSGERSHLGAITKRGDGYLRTLLIHGGRSVVKSILKKHAAGHPLTSHEQWVLGVYQRRGFNKAAVAVANKNARIIAALLRDGQAYRTSQTA